MNFLFSFSRKKQKKNKQTSERQREMVVIAVCKWYTIGLFYTLEPLEWVFACLVETVAILWTLTSKIETI